MRSSGAAVSLSLAVPRHRLRLQCTDVVLYPLLKRTTCNSFELTDDRFHLTSDYFSRPAHWGCRRTNNIQGTNECATISAMLQACSVGCACVNPFVWSICIGQRSLTPRNAYGRQHFQFLSMHWPKEGKGALRDGSAEEITICFVHVRAYGNSPVLLALTCTCGAGVILWTTM